MTKKSPRGRIGMVPAVRPVARTPVTRPVGPVPRGNPIAQAPAPAVTRAPKVRPVGKPPNPRKPRLIKDVGGNELKDMFAIFKDLPRPHRPAPRLPSRLRGRPKRHR